MSALVRQHGPAVRIEIRAVEFGKLPFHAQIALAGETDILVGMHGAALVHSLYLARRPRGMLIELKPASRRTGNYQFHNLAGTQGHDYVEYDAMRRVDDRDMNAIADFVREGVVRILGARRAGNETRP
jgi:capsular polysaccharide biosynthesis protein